MITLSEETGGKYYYAEAGDLEKTFEQLSEDLRTQYLLGYYPAHRFVNSSFRRISVKLTKPGTEADQVRNRTGYYAPEAK